MGPWWQGFQDEAFWGGAAPWEARGCRARRWEAPTSNGDSVPVARAAFQADVPPRSG
jgi:hypothetical protein